MVRLGRENLNVPIGLTKKRSDTTLARARSPSRVPDELVTGSTAFFFFSPTLPESGTRLKMGRARAFKYERSCLQLRWVSVTRELLCEVGCD